MPILGKPGQRLMAVVGAALVSATVIVGVTVVSTGGDTAPDYTPPCTGECWPDASTTGVPDGTTLTEFTGLRSGATCYLNTDNQTVTALRFTGCDVAVMAANVTIRNSMVNGHLSVDHDRPNSSTWSVLVEDSTIDAGQSFGAAVSNGNITIRRSEIKGGQTIVQCTNNSSYCTVEDSWLHGQSIPAMEEQPHLGGVLNSGGPNFTMRHNRIACDNDNGCTGNVVMLPDFAPITNATIEGNLLMGYDTMAYCTYAGWRPNANAELNHDIVYRDNVFQRGPNNKCGGYGPVTGWRDDRPGNIWENNLWDDGTPVIPAG